MKVALIHFRLLQAGGLENRILNYSNWFIQNGHEVTLICNKLDPDFPIPVGATVVKLPKIPVPKVFNMMVFDWQLGRYMKGKQFDFSLGMGRTSHHEAVLAPGNHLGYLRALGKSPKGISDWAQIKMDNKGHNRSKIIFAASQMMKSELIELYKVPENKIHVLYPPLNIEKYKTISGEIKKAARKATGISETTRVFGFVSGSHSRKGLPLLLAAFEKLESENVLLLIAGKQKSNSKLKNVRDLGFMPEPKKLYELCDFLLHPAVYEPYGQIVAEALACGIPSIVSDKTGAGELIGKNEGLVLSPAQTGSWIETIKNADSHSFFVGPDWADKNQLSTDSHLKKMLKLAGKII